MVGRHEERGHGMTVNLEVEHTGTNGMILVVFVKSEE
jgi:hypothetical protein